MKTDRFWKKFLFKTAGRLNPIIQMALMNEPLGSKFSYNDKGLQEHFFNALVAPF
jgi:hypothetical protein